jgi:hypothetical protein
MLSFETPLINAEDVDIPVCVANADEAIAIIRKHREEWSQSVKSVANTVS